MDLRNSGVLESFSSGKIPPSMSRPLTKFYRGEPMALGITQILIGILEMAFGIVATLGDTHKDFYDLVLHTPEWTGSLYIISGSLSVAAAKNPRMPLVKGALGMNVVSAVASGLVMVFSSFSLTFQLPPTYYYYCGHYLNNNDTRQFQACYELHKIPYVTLYHTVAFLLTLTALEFLITIVSAAFGCDSICRNTFSDTTIVIFQNTPEASASPLPDS